MVKYTISIYAIPTESLAASTCLFETKCDDSAPTSERNTQCVEDTTFPGILFIQGKGTAIPRWLKVAFCWVRWLLSLDLIQVPVWWSWFYETCRYVWQYWSADGGYAGIILCAVFTWQLTLSHHANTVTFSFKYLTTARCGETTKFFFPFLKKLFLIRSFKNIYAKLCLLAWRNV